MGLFTLRGLRGGQMTRGFLGAEEEGRRRGDSGPMIAVAPTAPTMTATTSGVAPPFTTGPVPAGMPGTLPECWKLITKLRGDVATLTTTIRTYNQPPAPGQTPTGLQAAYQMLIKQVQTLQLQIKNGAAGGGNNAALLKQLADANAQATKLRGDVATLTTTIRTYNQPPAPGQKPTGLQAAYRMLITQVQQLQLELARLKGGH